MTKQELDAIAQDAELAYLYARNVVKKPWKPGEAAIARDACWAFLYACYVVKGPWKPGEAAIAKEPRWAKDYEEFLRSLNDRS